MRDRFDPRRRGVNVRVGSEQAILVPQQQKAVRVHGVRYRGGQSVVIAKYVPFQLFYCHYIILVDDRNGPDAQDRFQRVSYVQVALTVGNVRS